MWLQLLSMVGKPIVGYFAKRAERRHILAKMDALTEGELKLGKHDIDCIRTRDKLQEQAMYMVARFWIKRSPTYGYIPLSLWGKSPYSLFVGMDDICR